MATHQHQLQLQLHFILVPLMTPGHLIPMVDIAKLLALHGMAVTVVTTPLNATRFSKTIRRNVESGLSINVLELRFPVTEAGLPEGCENMENLTSRSLIRNFYDAASMLQDPLEEALEALQPRPSCLISGKNLPWTVDTARKFGIPRIFFDGMGCFSSCVGHKLEVSGVHEAVASKFEQFFVPDLPHRIQLTRAKLPEFLVPGSKDLSDVRNKMKATDVVADGILVNTFEELETEYVKEYKRVKGDNRVWCIGPVSGCNKLELDKAERGRKASVDEKDCLKWLDLMEPRSVIYACLGSICGLMAEQLAELALGLEASDQPFIWVIRDGPNSEGIRKWIADEGFEERIKGRGLLIRGWAPQVLILSHPSVGGFLTHCGWNSTLEGVTAGVPMVTCPLFAEQFINEQLLVEVLGVGVSVGVENAVTWGMEDKFGLVMRKEQVKEAIHKVLVKGEGGGERRRRAKELGDIAKMAIEEGGSSFLDLEMFIQHVHSTIISLNVL